MIRKTSKRSSHTRYADRLFATAVKARDGVCRKCGCAGPLECAHLFPRRFYSVRWEMDNAVALCNCPWHQCHRKFDTDGMERWNWIIGELGAERYEALERLRASTWDKDVVGAVNRLRGLSGDAA